MLRAVLDADRIAALEDGIRAAAGQGDDRALDRQLRKLERAQVRQPEVARALLDLVAGGVLGHERAVPVVDAVERAHGDDLAMLAQIGKALEGARDIDLLNAAPPDDEVFLRVVDGLAARLDDARGETLIDALGGLAVAARMVARQRDDIAERSYRRLVELEPERSSHHYNLGLFFKTRGRFAEGVAANREAIRRSAETVDAYEWNLGICATGARQGEVALEVWKRMEQVIDAGRFGLPEGGYPPCKVRLAERPLAERGAAADDPGLEETIWIERLSPCHGVVRSVLYGDLGVDYGDVVLIDGAPITYHRYGDREVAVFPHLATLERSDYRRYDFAGTQAGAGQLEDLSDALPDDAVVYSHTESYKRLCASCWRNPDVDHETHDDEQKHVVTGRLAAPPGIEPARLLAELDAALAAAPDCRLYAPALCEAAGEARRAEIERRRYAMLCG